MTETIHGIEYSHPTVVLLQDTGIGTSEYAARTCYDSFEASENKCVRYLNDGLSNGFGEQDPDIKTKSYLAAINGTEHSDLLDTLAWTHFHHSILEHANLTFLIKGTSRGVLQEHARHRIQAISVRSTRYTMSSVINAFVASLVLAKESDTLRSEYSAQWFLKTVQDLGLFVTTNLFYNRKEIEAIFNKMHYQLSELGYDQFIAIAVAKSSLPLLETSTSVDDLYLSLEVGKKKRNVGDAFKHIVTDNWKVDMVVTMNLRALKNYLDLRDSGAAYFQIQWLAKAMKDVTPDKYLDLIVKKN